MLRYVIYTCRLHIRDMFDEMPVMASRGPFKVSFKGLHLYCNFLVILLFQIFDSILASDSGSRPEKVAQILGTLTQH